MAEHAAHLVDEVLPDVAIRQWVLTVPFQRRKQLAWRPGLARGVLAVAMETIFDFLTAKAAAELGVVGGRAGSVTFLQRFGSALNVNLHYHGLLPDGVFARDDAGMLVFHRVSPTHDEVAVLVERIALRAAAWLHEHGADDDEEEDPDEQMVLVAASVERRVATGPRVGQPVQKVRVPVRDEETIARRCAAALGYNLHAGTVVLAGDRPGLERLCRYVARPPLSLDRLSEQPDGTVVLRLRRAWRDGTVAVKFTKGEFVEKLLAITPPPRAAQVLYHGVLAAHAAWRREVVPDPDALADQRKEQAASDAKRKLAKRARRSRWSSWVPWAYLLKRVFGVDGWECARCASPMSLRAVVIGAPATTRVLAGLAAATAQRPAASAQGPPATSATC